MLDVLKPHQPSITEFAQETEGINGVGGVNAKLLEIDEEVQNSDFISELKHGASFHSTLPVQD